MNIPAFFHMPLLIKWQCPLIFPYAVIDKMANARLILPDIRLSAGRDQVSRLYAECLMDANTAFAQMEGE